MSTAYQARNAEGSKGQLRAGKVRHTVTLDRELFEAIKSAAIINQRSISEEMAERLALVGQLADPDKTDTTALSDAIHDFERELPGWWWSVGTCFVSRDASCGPQISGPDGDLARIKRFDDGFHCDDKAAGSTLAGSLRSVMTAALAAKAEHESA